MGVVKLSYLEKSCVNLTSFQDITMAEKWTSATNPLRMRARKLMYQVKICAHLTSLKMTQTVGKWEQGHTRHQNNNKNDVLAFVSTKVNAALHIPFALRAKIHGSHRLSVWDFLQKNAITCCRSHSFIHKTLILCH